MLRIGLLMRAKLLIHIQVVSMRDRLSYGVNDETSQGQWQTEWDML